MINVTEEKEKLTKALTDQYSKSNINLSDYESMVDQVTKVDSVKELRIVQKHLSENCELTLYEDKPDNYGTIFSWRNITAKSINGNAGNFSCIFGGTEIKVNDLPLGNTTLNVKAVFGLIKILVPKNIRIVNNVTPVFSGVFAPNIYEHDESGDGPVLNITGESVFGNITIIKI
jgi:hypothetical protein